MKTCSKCKRELPLDQFNKEPRVRSGLTADCKQCRNKRTHAARRRRGFGVRNRMHKYGLTRQEVEAYLQIPACQICYKKFQSDTDMCFDHCHQHGTIRGVLCQTCNCCLRGTTAECIVRNERAIDYLLRSLEVRHETA